MTESMTIINTVTWNKSRSQSVTTTQNRLKWWSRRIGFGGGRAESASVVMEESKAFNKLPQALRNDLEKLGLSVQLGKHVLSMWHFRLETVTFYNNNK